MLIYTNTPRAPFPSLSLPPCFFIGSRALLPFPFFSLLPSLLRSKRTKTLSSVLRFSPQGSDASLSCHFSRLDASLSRLPDGDQTCTDRRRRRRRRLPCPDSGLFVFWSWLGFFLFIFFLNVRCLKFGFWKSLGFLLLNGKLGFVKIRALSEECLQAICNGAETDFHPWR